MSFHDGHGKKAAMSSSDHSHPHAGTDPQTQAGSALAAHAIARAQHLVDSRPEGPYQLDWCQEALHFGDLSVFAISLMTQTATTPAHATPRGFR
jgi:hypothetical protein